MSRSGRRAARAIYASISKLWGRFAARSRQSIYRDRVGFNGGSNGARHGGAGAWPAHGGAPNHGAVPSHAAAPSPAGLARAATAHGASRFCGHASDRRRAPAAWPAVYRPHWPPSTTGCRQAATVTEQPVPAPPVLSFELLMPCPPPRTRTGRAAPTLRHVFS